MVRLTIPNLKGKFPGGTDLWFELQAGKDGAQFGQSQLLPDIFIGGAFQNARY